MDPTCATCSPDTGMVYQAAMARRAQEQQRVEGAAAVRLIDESAASAPPTRSLPPDATISVRA